MYSLINLSNTINLAQKKYKHIIQCPVSALAINITTLLFQENLIRGFFIETKNKKYYVSILLKYGASKLIFQKLIFMSKFFSYKKNTILKLQNGLGLYLISTSKGLVTNNNAAKLKLGGIVLIKML